MEAGRIPPLRDKPKLQIAQKVPNAGDVDTVATATHPERPGTKRPELRQSGHPFARFSAKAPRILGI